ncbi:RHS repeat-associated core domain-containing protein [Idiomarina abyssalis]|uniref:RHS repeat-associated core domain-containing protein n=1 Tax=Idiomarina abyssalis TaxID=86102 RepID=UPI003A8DB31A
MESPIRFQGQWLDEETGLYYNRYRYYDSKQGRYITQDPIGLAGGLNSYAYVANPTGWVDPLGLRQVGEQSRPIRDTIVGQIKGIIQDEIIERREPTPLPAQLSDHAVYDDCFNNERIMECERRVQDWSQCFDLDKPYVGNPKAMVLLEAIRSNSINTACRINNLCSLIDENNLPIKSNHPKFETWPENAPECN